jgi:hypothetical protein
VNPVPNSAEIDVALALDVLLRRDAHDLWSVATHRECLRFLRVAGPRLSDDQCTQLASAIVKGPSPSLFRENLDPEMLKEEIERDTWIRLAKLRQAGVVLPEVASTRLEEIEARRPEWDRREEQGEELVSRTAVRWGFETQYTVEELHAMPERRLADLLATEKQQRQALLWTWHQLVQQEPDKAAGVLQYGEENGVVPDVLSNALSGLTVRTSKSALGGRTWDIVAGLLLQTTEQILAQICREAAQWLSHEARELPDDREQIFLELWDRLWPLAMKVTRQPRTDPLTGAINHPAGHLAEALLDRLWARRPTIGSGIPADLGPRFTDMAEGEADGHAQSRIVLASRLYWLHWTDPAWAERYIIPRLYFSGSLEAAALWRGYLWSAQVGPNLMAAFRDALIDAVRHRGELGDARRNLVRLFTFACVELPASVPDDDIRHMLRTVETEDLAEVAGVLADILEGAGEDAPVTWRERVRPWLNRLWPTDANKQDPKVTCGLARLAIRAGQEFPDAVDTIIRFLAPSRDTMHVLHLLRETKLASQFPEATVNLLRGLIDIQSGPVHYGAHHGLRDVLERSAPASRELSATPQFRELMDYAQRHGQ